MRNYSTIISFPGLGIGEFEVNNVAFSVFGLDIAWYGLIITVGMILAFVYASWRAVKHEYAKFDDMLDYAIYLIISGVIGARAYYVIMHGGYNSFLEVISIRDGGLAIYGGIIGGAIAAFIVTKVKKLNFGKIADAIMPGVMLAQAIGRWGNFMNGEAHGGITSLPWRMGISNGYITQYVHPTFLYESLWNLIGFALVNLIYRKKKFNGEIALMCMTWYGFGRMFIEGLRTDSLYIGDIRVSQLLAFLTFIVGTALIVFFEIRARKTAPKQASADAVAVIKNESGAINSNEIVEDYENTMSSANNDDENSSKKERDK